MVRPDDRPEVLPPCEHQTEARMSQNLNPRRFFLTALFYFTEPFLFPQRASFSLRVSVMKARNLMAKDANGENISIHSENIFRRS